MTNELFPQFQQIFQGHESIDIDNSVMLDGNHPVLLDPDLYQQTLNIVQKLPVANYDFLRALLSHLKRISQNYEVNKMGINNLSLVWRPTIQFGGTLFVFLTFHSDTIFSGRERQHNLILPARGSSLKNHSELVTPVDSTIDSSADQENKDDILDDNVFDDKYACEPVVAAESPPDLMTETGPFQEAQDSVGLMDDSMAAPAKPSRSKKTYTDFEVKLETQDQNNDDFSILLDLIADATTPVQPNTPAEGNPEKSTVDVKTIQNNQYVNKGSLQHLNVSTQSLLVAKHADRGSQNLKRSEQAIAQPDVLDDDYKHSSSKLSSKNANENTRKSYGYESSQPDSPHSSRSMSPEQFNDDAEIDGPLPPMLKPRRVRH